MSQFIEIPATNQSLAQRKFVYGVGVNDATYLVQPYIDGKRGCCPFYLTWRNMLKRCYSPELHLILPTYKGCSVCPEWLLFTSFRSWMERQNWVGLHLDKDIIEHGNKVYCPGKCLFVTAALNALLTNCGLTVGELPPGVCVSGKKFQAKCSIYGSKKHLGNYPTIREASQAYCKFKHDVILLRAKENPDLSAYLIKHAERVIDEVRSI